MDRDKKILILLVMLIAFILLITGVFTTVVVNAASIAGQRVREVIGI
jgi:uncharacterized membrane protein